MTGTLYHNNGNGTFTNVTAKAGIDYPGRGWGVIAADFTGDGWPDIYAANDGERQNLWVNQHDGTFKDEALDRGVAFSGAGAPEAGMGTALGDIFNDGRLSLFITHVHGEKNTLYVPGDTSGRSYSDQSAMGGMAPSTFPTRGGDVDFSILTMTVTQMLPWSTAEFREDQSSHTFPRRSLPPGGRMPNRICSSMGMAMAISSMPGAPAGILSAVLS